MKKTILWLVGSEYRSEVIVMKFDQTLNKSNKICQGQSRFNLTVIQVYEISTLSCLEFWRYLDRNHGRQFDVLAAFSQQAQGSEHQSFAGNH